MGEIVEALRFNHLETDSKEKLPMEEYNDLSQRAPSHSARDYHNNLSAEPTNSKFNLDVGHSSFGAQSTGTEYSTPQDSLCGDEFVTSCGEEFITSKPPSRKSAVYSHRTLLRRKQDKHLVLSKYCAQCLNRLRYNSFDFSKSQALRFFNKKLCEAGQSKSRGDSNLRTLFLTLLLSFVLLHSCHGYVLDNNPRHELRRVKHSIDDNQPFSSPSSPPPSSSSSSPSSPASFIPLNSQPSTSASTNNSNSNRTTDSRNSDPSQVSNLASKFISVLQKMHVLPVSNTSFCISLEEIHPGKSINKPDPSSSSSHFTISLTFKVTNLDKTNTGSDYKNENSTDNSQNSTSSQNASSSAAQFPVSFAHDCVSDPKVLLALILDENGILVNTLASPETGRNQGGPGAGNSGNTGTTKDPAGLSLEAGNLSRTQVVVIATCSAIIGFFFLSAAFLRIRNYVKRLQSEKANERRKKFRSCSFALRNSGQSTEQLRRDSLNSKASQMNSQSNVSAQEMSTPSSPRRADMDTSPYLLVTMAALDPASSSSEIQGDLLYNEDGDKDKMTLPLNKSPGNSLSSSRQPSPIGDISQRVSPIPSGAIQTVKTTPRGSLYRGGSSGSGGGVSTSSSNPKIYASAAPTQHPQLAKVRGVGLARASSLGNSRDAKIAHMPQRGSLKLLRNNNRVAGKDLPPPPVSNGRCVFANAFVSGGGNYMVPKNGTYNNGRVPLESMKSVSFDVDRDYQSGSSNCLTCNAISKRLDMICHNLKDTHCPFTMSSIHRNHQGFAGIPAGGLGPENMSVEATLNNAGAALSFPVLAAKDVKRNSQTQAEGVVNYAYPSSTSSSPGEVSQRGMTNPERLSTSFPNSRQDLRSSSQDLEKNGAHSANELQNGLEVSPDTLQPLQYYPSTSRDECGYTVSLPVSPYKQIDKSENNNVHSDSDRAPSSASNCDRLHEPLVNTDSSSPDTDFSPVINSAMQSPASKMSSEDELSFSDNAKSIFIENTMQDKNSELCSETHNRRLTKSNENVDLFNKTRAIDSSENTNGSLPCILSPKSKAQQSQTPHCNGENKSSSTSPQDVYDENAIDYNDEYPLCARTKPHKLALFPNRRRTMNKKYDNGSDGSAHETSPECETSENSNETADDRMEEDTLPHNSSTDSSRDLSSPSTDSGEKEGLLHEYSNQGINNPEYLSQSASNDSYQSLSPVSPQPSSSSPFLPSSASTEYIL